MSSLAEIYIKTETLETLAKTAAKKGMAGVSLTISLSDETNEYGQNVSGYVSQSKDEREAKKRRFYVGNGKVFWTDGKIEVAGEKAPQAAGPSPQEYEDDSLPF